MSEPSTTDHLFQLLEQLEIRTTTVSHPAVFTVEEAKAHRGELPGGHLKNLFVRNKKGRMWLIVAMEDRPLNLKELGAAIGAGRISFGSSERLSRFLGVIPGAVTPFAVMNDSTAEVTVAIDESVFEHDLIHCHPLVNTMTTAIAPSDLMRFLRACHHEPQIIDLS